jgi:hypothetical protein
MVVVSRRQREAGYTLAGMRLAGGAGHRAKLLTAPFPIRTSKGAVQALRAAAAGAPVAPSRRTGGPLCRDSGTARRAAVVQRPGCVERQPARLNSA